VAQQLADDRQAKPPAPKLAWVLAEIMKTHASSSTKHDVLERVVICTTQRIGAVTYRRTADF